MYIQTFIWQTTHSCEWVVSSLPFLKSPAFEPEGGEHDILRYNLYSIWTRRNMFSPSHWSENSWDELGVILLLILVWQLHNLNFITWLAYHSECFTHPYCFIAFYFCLQGPISPDYLGFSIFTCLCCFWCVGIPALVKSVSTRDANARGDPNAAAYSREALLLNKIALGKVLYTKLYNNRCWQSALQCQATIYHRFPCSPSVYGQSKKHQAKS